MKKKLIIVGIIAVLAIVGIMKYRRDAIAPEVQGMLVKASKPQQINLPDEVQAIGSLSARSVQITPEIAGHIEKIQFQDGAQVKAGTVLIQLDDATSRAQYESVKAQLGFSENDYRRKSILGKKGYVTKQDVDQADANLKQKRAEVLERQVLLKKMQLTAPFDGAIGKVNVNPGEYVNVGQTLVTLTDIHHLHIEYNVPEKFLPYLKLGQEVKITSTTYPGRVFSGKLAYISPAINTDNRSLSLYAEVPNDKNELAPGMFVEVTQSIGSTDKALMIPARSLMPILDGEQVFKIVDGKAQSVPVKIGKRTADQVQIVEGLSSSDMIITDGQTKVKNGMPVKVST